MGDAILSIIDWLFNVAKSFFLSLVDLLKDLFFWVLDSILTLVTFLLELVFSALSLLDITNYVSALPADALQAMGALGVGEAFGIIISAVLVRITLQLIPFTRLGS